MFKAWAKQQGWVNPFDTAYAAFRGHLKEDGAEWYLKPYDKDISMPTEAEYYFWLKAEKAYTALTILEKNGYLDFVKFCDKHGNIIDLKAKVLPCWGKDGNCWMNCKYYGLDCGSLTTEFIDFNKVLLEYLGKAG